MSLFNNTALELNADFNQVSDSIGKNNLWSKGQQAEMWKVDDRVVDNPQLRFQRSQSSFAEMIYDNGCGSVMNSPGVPEGLVAFLEKKFVGPLNIKQSKYVSVKEAAERGLNYLDWQEPYFFLVDMPISLSQDNYTYTYRNKATGSIFQPDKLETFQVNKGWDFPHYMFAHRIMTDHKTAAIVQGRTVMMPDNSRPMTIIDVLKHVASAVFGDFSYVESCVSEWSSSFYEDVKYDVRSGTSIEMINEIEAAEENDQLFWMAVVIGTFTWLKSPHGLKYLIKYHPLYYEMLDWDHDRNTAVISKDTGGWGIVDGWTIYTARDVDRLAGIKPGTCCVSQQELHCTERVNVKAVMKDCYCGAPRDYTVEEYWMGDRSAHRTQECKRWEQENPAQMVFVSYAAMYNILNKLDPMTKCQRYSCPRTTCSYHAGNAARIRALTDHRTKMLTSSRPS